MSTTIEKNIVVRKPGFDHDWEEFEYTDHNDSKLILEIGNEVKFERLFFGLR